MCRWVDVANAYHLTPGSRRDLDVYGVIVAVFNIDGEYYAFKDACPNDGRELLKGEVRGDEIICPRHGERYSIRTGVMLDQPAKEKLDIFPVRVSRGMVQIEIEMPELH
ncbi:MAG: Rieske (2Fe-2S) protein [Nitrosomonadales bacterium]|nr:Rieske (2Fe-2S) protein [Nitrosomonadales bacterium]